jgi:hypothetical protein
MIHRQLAAAAMLLSGAVVTCTGGGGDGTFPNVADGGGTSGTSGATTSGDPGTSSGGACIANGQPCAPKDSVCVGDCQGRSCCSGLCVNNTTCVAPNVDYTPTCAPAACGGDPQGIWHLAGACGRTTDACTAAATGGIASSGTLTVNASGTASSAISADLHACGWIDHSSADFGFYSADAGTFGGKTYCVQGNTLWIILSPNASPMSDGTPILTALKFTR